MKFKLILILWCASLNLAYSQVVPVSKFETNNMESFLFKTNEVTKKLQAVSQGKMNITGFAEVSYEADGNTKTTWFVVENSFLGGSTHLIVKTSQLLTNNGLQKSYSIQAEDVYSKPSSYILYYKNDQLYKVDYLMKNPSAAVSFF